MTLNYKKKLLISQIIRIVTTLIILYTLNIPIFIKIPLIILTDSIDCGIPHYLFDKWINCNTNIYQTTDKITDIVCYTLLLVYILKYGGLSSNYNYLLILLFIYRLIGTYLFLIKKNRTYLFYFPNFFLEICFGLVLINNFLILKNYKEFILISIVIYKIILEYYLHIYKNTKIM